MASIPLVPMKIGTQETSICEHLLWAAAPRQSKPHGDPWVPAFAGTSGVGFVSTPSWFDGRRFAAAHHEGYATLANLSKPYGEQRTSVRVRRTRRRVYRPYSRRNASNGAVVLSTG